MPTATLQSLTFPRRVLAGHLAILSALANRRTIPILTGVRIRADGERATLEATDLATRVRITMPCEGEGEVVLPAKLLSDLVQRLAAEAVEIEIDGQTATVRAGRSRTTLGGLDPDDWPAEQREEWSEPLAIPAETLRALSSVSFAVSSQPTRPILNGAWFHSLKGRLAAVATNGHRLARVQSDLTADLDAIIPAGGLSYALKLTEGEEEIEVRRSANVIAFRGGDAEVFVHLIEGPFPEYEGVISKDKGSLATLKRAELMDALKRVLLIALDDTRRVACHFAEGALTITAQKDGEIVEEVPMEDYVGGEITIGFNASYLLELMQQLRAPTVEIELRSPDRAVTIRGGTDDPFLLLMPLRLNK
jgi:DNA polymerase-3 subunit beta